MTKFGVPHHQCQGDGGQPRLEVAVKTPKATLFVKPTQPTKQKVSKPKSGQGITTLKELGFNLMKKANVFNMSF